MSTENESAASSALGLKNSSNNVVQTRVFSAFAAIALYNAVELVVLCFATFKRYRGCYFWSLLIASACIVPHCIGFIFFIFPLGITPYLSATMIIVSWWGMITGQSMVLWSRLHLVLQNPKILKAVLFMIVIDAILLQTPISVLFFGSISHHPDAFVQGYKIMEHIQLIGFCLQELTISGLYIWETTKMLRLRTERSHKNILIELLVINIVILILDIAIVGIEYAGYYALQVMFKPVAYSIKLKLEYSILGKLVEIAKGTCSDPDSNSHTRDLPSYGTPSSSGECISEPGMLPPPALHDKRSAS